MAAEFETRAAEARAMLDLAEEFRRLATDLPLQSRLRAHLMRSARIYRVTADSLSEAAERDRIARATRPPLRAVRP
jgi:hypothetical protein